MQLILAIDSDTRRSEQLATLVHATLTVDLVQATSAGEALHSLKDRIPDLILTAPLLSPFDDGVLDEYLRDLGTAAAHVQTLRIPMLSAGPRKGSVAKRLFSLGRSKKSEASSAASPEGCDPKVFADEIAHYLTRSLEERSASPTIVEQTMVQETDEHVPASAPAPLAQAVDDWAAPDTVITDALEPVRVVPVEPIEYTYTKPEPITFAEPEPVAIVEHIDIVTPAPVDTSRAEPTSVAGGTSTSASFEAALAAIRAAWTTPASTTTAPTVPNRAGSVTPRIGSGEVDLTNALDETPIGDSPGDDDSDAADDVDAPRQRPSVQTPKKKRSDVPRSRKAASDQADAWAVLDPNTCDFSALVKQLDEVTDADDRLRPGYGGHETATRATDVR